MINNNKHNNSDKLKFENSNLAKLWWATSTVSPIPLCSLLGKYLFMTDCLKDTALSVYVFKNQQHITFELLTLLENLKLNTSESNINLGFSQNSEPALQGSVYRM